MKNFFAMISRMKYINRWGLMRNTRNENICEHSHEVAVVAHALALIKNTRFGGSTDPQRVAILALYHDATEIITGDLPTPIKYHSEKIRSAYKEVESLAVKKLSSMLPEDLKDHYNAILSFEGTRDKEYIPLVKAADKISALIKCTEEKKSGNREFEKAEQTIKLAIKAMNLPEADFFIKEFLPTYELTIDEQD